MVALVLGPVLFQDFEIPQEIPFGGSQSLVVKKLVGGTRVIDAMGRDDMDIEWSGRFRGSLGEARARSLDALRVAGQPLLLTWSTLRFLVVIENFKANFQQTFEVPYSIRCTVIEDLSLPVLIVPADPDALIITDINGAVGISVNDAAVTAAVAGVATAAATVSGFQGAATATTAPVQASILSAQAVIATSAATNNGIVTPTATPSIAGIVAGGAPASLAATLSSQSAAFTELGQLYQLQALLGRASINITNAGTG
jgi:hypothetical protein